MFVTSYRFLAIDISLVKWLFMILFYRQVLIVMSTINPRKGSRVCNAISYTSSNRQTLEGFSDKTRKHNPNIPRELECLHLPRPIMW